MYVSWEQKDKKMHKELYTNVVQSTLQQLYKAYKLYIALATLTLILIVLSTALTKELPYYCYLPKTFNFSLMFLIQIYYALSIVFISTGFEGLYFGLCIWTYLQFKTLKHRAKSLNFEDGATLKDFVSSHRDLIEVFENLKKIYSWMFFSKIVSTTLLSCLNIYTFSNISLNEFGGFTRNIQFVLFLNAQVYLLCYIANLITDEAAAISFEIYNLKWFEQIGRYGFIKTYMVMVLQQAQAPLVFTAGGLVQMKMVVITYVRNYIEHCII